MTGEERQKLNQAINAGVRRDYQSAARILSDLIAASDAPPEAYLFLGRSFHALQDYPRALAAFNDYVKLKPRSPEGYRFAGRAYLTIGMPQKAVPLLEKALHYRKNDAITMALLGAAYLKSKRAGEAAEILMQAVETAEGREAAEDTPPIKALPARERRRIYRAYLNSLLIWGIKLCRAENYDLGAQALRFVLENGDEIIREMALLRLELGRACRELGFLEEAAQHYERALEYAPEDNRIRWYRASVLMSLGRNREALEDIDIIRSTSDALQGIREDLPWNSEMVDRFMIQSFLETGEWRRAADSAKNWLKNRSRDPLIHSMYAEALRNLKDYPAAINHLQRALELAPEELELLYALALTSWEGQDLKTLKRALRKIKTLDGDRDIIRRFTALLESKTQEDDRTILAALQNAIRELGPDPELMYALGEAYLRVGLIENAINWFDTILTLRGDHEKAWLGTIAAYEALEKEGQETAQQELRKAYDGYLALWPDNRLIRRDRALFLIHSRQFDDASEELEALLIWEANNPTLRRALAYAYRKTGKYQKAAIFLKALLKEKPKNLDILLEYSGCLARAGAATYAAAVLQKARPLFPESAEIPLALGYLYYKEKKNEQALDQFREAAAKAPKDPRPYRLMSLACRQAGDRESAEKYEGEAKKRS